MNTSTEHDAEMHVGDFWPTLSKSGTRKINLRLSCNSFSIMWPCSYGSNPDVFTALGCFPCRGSFWSDLFCFLVFPDSGWCPDFFQNVSSTPRSGGPAQWAKPAISLYMAAELFRGEFTCPYVSTFKRKIDINLFTLFYFKSHLRLFD